MEEASEFIDEQRDSLDGGSPESDPGWRMVRFDLEDENPEEGEEAG